MLIGRIKEPNLEGGSDLTASNEKLVKTPKPHPTAPSKGRPISVTTATRREVLRRISETGVRGELYCQAVDKIKLSTRLDWQKRDGCPKTYLEA